MCATRLFGHSSCCFPHTQGSCSFPHTQGCRSSHTLLFSSQMVETKANRLTAHTPCALHTHAHKHRARLKHPYNGLLSTPTVLLPQAPAPCVSAQRTPHAGTHTHRAPTKHPSNGHSSLLTNTAGTGSLRVGAEFLATHYSGPKVIYIPKPTWPTHMKVFKNAGMQVRVYLRGCIALC